MSYFSVDIEADGPYPGDYSMVCFGAVKVTDALDKTFYGATAPISDKWVPEALAISGIPREYHSEFKDPEVDMQLFALWIEQNTVGRPIFISDNPGDWSFINYYLLRYAGRNPFGWSGRRIGDLYCGLVKDTFAKWKHLRKTIADHNPVHDAMGNAEVILHMRDNMGLKITLK